MKKIKWGIIGTGYIARKFARGLEVIPEAELIGVGSRSRERALSFARDFNIPEVYSYEELVKNLEIDVIYVASTNELHKEHTLMSLRGGKAVLCEKPFALNAVEAKEMINLARENNLFLMEAMWTRFLPVIVKVREWITEGKIGELKLLQANFGISRDVEPDNRLFNPVLGGGSLLDLGIYPVSFASMLFGQQPEQIEALANIGSTGVDEQTAVLFRYPRGKLAYFSSTIRAETDQEACIVGSEGFIKIPFFYRATTAMLYRNNELMEKIEIEHQGTGLNYEAEEVIRCLYKGNQESSIMPLEETLAIIKTMDNIRNKIGLQFPVE